MNFQENDIHCLKEAATQFFSKYSQDKIDMNAISIVEIAKAFVLCNKKAEKINQQLIYDQDLYDKL